jgi:multiple sugar transport system ATP-binding protein
VENDNGLLLAGQWCETPKSSFLFDEPLSNLDAKLRVQMRTEISKLHNRLESTMIYVTHDQVEAMTMGDRIVILRDGKVQQIDSPLNLYNHPANKFVAGFIGSPAMNFLTCRVIQNGGLMLDEGGIQFPVPESISDRLKNLIDGDVIFGIRPESIWTSDNADRVELKATVQAKVDVVEPMGSEIYVYLNTGQNNLIARLEARDLPKPGTTVDLVFDLSAVHFFDVTTQEVL